MTWRTLRLEDVATVGPRDPTLSSDAPFVPMAAVAVGRRFPVEYEARGSRAGVRARANDVLFARITPCLENGKLAQVPADSPPCGASTEFLVVRPGPALDPGFLYYWCSSPEVRKRAEQEMTGTTGRMRFAAGSLRDFAISVPPLDEQTRLVALLEDHLSRLDAAAAYLRGSLQKLDAVRRLVVRELANADPIPLTRLTVSAGYGTSVKCEVGGPGPAVVRIPNLVRGRIDLSDEKRAADPSIDLAAAMLVPGDVLIVRTNGSKDLIGRSGVVQEGVDAAFASYLIRYRVDTARICPEWLHVMLGSPRLRAEIERLAASSAGQHNLSLSKLDGLLIPTPSIEDQEAGLARLAVFDDHANALRKVLEETLLRGENLRRSLLAAAFSGRLTDTAADMSDAKETIGA